MWQVRQSSKTAFGCISENACGIVVLLSACRHVSVGGTVAALAACALRRRLFYGDCLIVGVLVEVRPNVRVARFANVAAYVAARESRRHCRNAGGAVCVCAKASGNTAGNSIVIQENKLRRVPYSMMINDASFRRSLMVENFTNLLPCAVPRVSTNYRKIVTDLPVPESLPIFEVMYRTEPRAMRGQLPVVWPAPRDFRSTMRGAISGSIGPLAYLLPTRAMDEKRSSMLLCGRHRRRYLPALHSPTNRAPIWPRGWLCSAGAAEKDVSVFHRVGGHRMRGEIVGHTFGVKTGGRGKHVIVSFEKSFHADAPWPRSRPAAFRS